MCVCGITTGPQQHRWAIVKTKQKVKEDELWINEQQLGSGEYLTKRHAPDPGFVALFDPYPRQSKSRKLNEVFNDRSFDTELVVEASEMDRETSGWLFFSRRVERRRRLCRMLDVFRWRFECSSIAVMIAKSNTDFKCFWKMMLFYSPILWLNYSSFCLRINFNLRITNISPKKGLICRQNYTGVWGQGQ